MMVVEIVAGISHGSMALLADGWHMGTHAAALGINVFAYAFARRRANDPRYTFGTGNVGALGGFASAVGLAVGALFVFAESAVRVIASWSVGLLRNSGAVLLDSEGPAWTATTNRGGR